MLQLISKSAVVGAMVLASTAAQAGAIDLFGLPGNFDQSTFGSTGSYVYAQSVTADGTNFASLDFSVADRQGGSFDLLITGSRNGGMLGTGQLPDADNILFQQNLSHNGDGAQTFSLTPNVGVTSGDVLFFVLSAHGGSLSGATVRATQFYGRDRYAGGEFIFSNTNAPFSNALSFGSRYSAKQDLVFSANFAAVSSQPSAAVSAPTAIGLLMSGLGLIVLIKARKKTG